MANKKEIRSDNTYIISTDNTDNPKLGAKLLSNGQESLFLDYYFGYSMVYNNKKDMMEPKKRRRREFLKLYLWQAPRTQEERLHNKETLLLAKKIRYEKQQQISDEENGYRLMKKESVNLLEYFKEFADTTKVADNRVIKCALNDFRDFLSNEYPQYSNKLYAKNLNKQMIEDFVAYLLEHHKGYGAQSYFKRFKRMINYAVEQGEIKNSPCKGIAIPKLDDVLTKDILSQEELIKLFATHYDKENPEIRRAFAMTCYTGIRRCDIIRLTYSNVDYSNKKLTFRQNKTQGHSSNSGVTILLNDFLLSVIGKKSENAIDDYIFHLPSDTMCFKALRRWTKEAGINKHITWHCGRHSCATNLLINGFDIKTVSSLLGHTTLKYTEIYLRTFDERKRDAINSLPNIEL